MNLLTFTDIRIIAVKEGVPDNKVEIGIQAKNNGYYQIKKRIDGKVKTFYFKQ